MYSLFILLAVLAIWAQLAALRTNQWSAWMASGLCQAGLLATQWFGILPIVVLQVACMAGLHYRRFGAARAEMGDFAIRWAAALAIMALALAPLAPYLVDQMGEYLRRGAGVAFPSVAGTDATDTGGGISVYTAIANFIWAVLGYHSDRTMAQIASLWPLGMLLGLALLGRPSNMPSGQREAIWAMVRSEWYPSTAQMKLAMAV